MSGTKRGEKADVAASIFPTKKEGGKSLQKEKKKNRPGINVHCVVRSFNLHVWEVGKRKGKKAVSRTPPALPNRWFDPGKKGKNGSL